MRRLVRSALAVVVAGLSLSACSAQLLSQTDVLDLDSSQNINPTGNFSVTGTWTLTGSFDCSRARARGASGASGLQMTVINSDDQSSNSEHPQVTLSGTKGSQTLRFTRGGTFSVQVDTPCDWHLSVVDMGTG